MNKPLPACLTAALTGSLFPERLYLSLMQDELLTIRLKDPQKNILQRHPLNGRMRRYCVIGLKKYNERQNANAHAWVISHICLNPRTRQRMI